MFDCAISCYKKSWTSVKTYQVKQLDFIHFNTQLNKPPRKVAHKRKEAQELNHILDSLRSSQVFS